MKKILALTICIIMVMFAFVGCTNEHEVDYEVNEIEWFKAMLKIRDLVLAPSTSSITCDFYINMVASDSRLEDIVTEGTLKLSNGELYIVATYNAESVELYGIIDGNGNNYYVKNANGTWSAYKTDISSATFLATIGIVSNAFDDAKGQYGDYRFNKIKKCYEIATKFGYESIMFNDKQVYSFSAYGTYEDNVFYGDISITDVDNTVVQTPEL